MMGRLLALGAAAVAALAAIGAAVRAKRRTDARPGKESPTGMSTKAAPATVPREASPGAPVAADAPVRGDVDGDDLTSIKGIGTVSAERLAGIGVTTFAQIAAWAAADVDDIGARIKISPERIRREDWVGQAGELLEA